VRPVGGAARALCAHQVTAHKAQRSKANGNGNFRTEKPIAAVREYMDEQKWSEAEAQIPQVAQAIENAAAGINKAAQDFEQGLAQVH
jgi:hypothetical protein